MSPGALAMLLGRPLHLRAQADYSSTGAEQQLQRRQSSAPPPACAGLAHDSFRLSFPLTLSHAFTGLVAILMIGVHDAS
jgi:hypothetical protein